MTNMSSAANVQAAQVQRSIEPNAKTRARRSILAPRDDWEQMFDGPLVAAVLSGKPAERRGASKFLSWLLDSRPGSRTGKVRAAFTHDDSVPLFGDVGHEIAFVETYKEWVSAVMTAPGQMKRTTRIQDLGGAKRLFEAIAGTGHRGIPHTFKASWIRLPSLEETPDSPSLGESSWPELEGLKGAERERHSLELVRADFLEEFLLQESFFRFGQSVLSGDTPHGTDAEARSVIRNVLLDFLRVIGDGPAPSGVTGDKKVVPQYHPIRSRDLWRRAGGPDPYSLTNKNSMYHMACLAAVGPSVSMVDAVMGVLICDTGWNVQPALDLSRHPFVFVTEGGAQIASSEFLSSFKNRAGKLVLGLLERTSVTDPSWQETALPFWNETVGELDSQRRLDGYAFLGEHGKENTVGGLDVLRRYMAMTELLRSRCPVVSECEALWLALTYRCKVQSYGCDGHGVQPRVVDYPRAKFLSRKGFTRRAIRKTVLLIRQNESSSMSAAASYAGHKRKHKIMPHYTNTPPVNAELDASVRTYQDSFQAVLVRAHDQDAVSFRLGMTSRDLQELRETAERSGVALILGFCEDDLEVDDAPGLHFRPAEPKALGELYLCHLALRRMQTFYPNRARFRRNFLPLLGLIKALGRMVFEKHLGPAYWSAARGVASMLRAGEISIPAFED